MLYLSLDIMHNRCNCYFSFWTIFCPFISLTAQNINIFKKMKNTPGDIIILQECTKNHDHMLYSSWDMVCDRCNYFSLWVIFYTFTLLTAWKIKIKKQVKKTPGDIIIFHKCTKNYDQMMYGLVPEIWCVTDVIISHFGPLFALLPP